MSAVQDKVDDLLLHNSFELVLTALIAHVDDWIADDLTGPLPPHILQSAQHLSRLFAAGVASAKKLDTYMELHL